MVLLVGVACGWWKQPRPVEAMFEWDGPCPALLGTLPVIDRPDPALAMPNSSDYPEMSNRMVGVSTCTIISAKRGR